MALGNGIAGMSRRRALWLLGLGTLALFVVLVLLDRRMQDTGGPGIIGFELAWSSERAAEILADWGADGRDAARLSLWLDFPFLLAYAAFLSLAVVAMREVGRRRGWPRFAAAGARVVVLPAVAALCDAVEDVSLLVVLDGGGGATAPALATGFAIAKFVALTGVELYLLGGLAALALALLRRRGSAAGR